VAEAHGGRVDVVARPGGGLDVTVALPRAATGAPASATPVAMLPRAT
ncbi:MAG: hypothetical protein QOJ82_3301, partial [Solirubrobacteraceae bacterium]|nr:hypothetical protein [Solirubrobacteraceae bacterium]